MPSVVLRQLSLSETQALLVPQSALAWPGFVHPGALPPPFVVQRAVAMVSNGAPGFWWLPFLIVDAAEQAVVGGCALKGVPRQGRAEVLYGVSKNCRGRGIASAAVRQLLAAAFAAGAWEVLAEIEPRNAGSVGVVKRCGFRRLGERRAHDGVVVEQWLLARPAGSFLSREGVPPV